MREGGRNQLSQGRRWGWRVALRDKSDSPARCELPEACVASEMVGQAAQSFLLSLRKCLWNYEKVCVRACVRVCVCVLLSQNWQVPRGVLIRKQTMRLGESRHLTSDRCCSRCFSALFDLTFITAQ